MEKNNIGMRAVALADYDELREIYYQIRTEEFTWTKNTVRSHADFDDATEGEIIFVAVIENKIAGFISIWEEDHFVHNLFVSKCFRRYGVGKALINKAISVFGTPLTLKCVKENKEAVQFYLANGWQIEKEEMGTEGLYYLMALNV